MAASSPDTHAVFPAVVNTVIDVVLVGDEDQCGRGADHSHYQDYRFCLHRLFRGGGSSLVVARAWRTLGTRRANDEATALSLIDEIEDIGGGL